MVVLTIVCVLTSLLRNNGIYAVVPTLVAVVFYLRRNNRKRSVAILIITLWICYSVNNIIYPNLGIEKGSIAEALSLPFQQTAKYVKIYYDDITPEEKTTIDEVLDFEDLPEAYDYNVSNPVKDKYRGDNSKLGAYFKAWFIMFFKHPSIYFSAFMDSSYGYMAPINQSIEATTDFDYAITGLQTFGLSNQYSSWGVDLTNAIRNVSLKIPLIKYLCMPGLYTWALILAIIVFIRRKKYSAIICCIPAVINVLVCLASPLSTSMRYSQPTVASVPFLIGMTMYYFQNEDRLEIGK